MQLKWKVILHWSLWSGYQEEIWTFHDASKRLHTTRIFPWFMITKENEEHLISWSSERISGDEVWKRWKKYVKCGLLKKRRGKRKECVWEQPPRSILPHTPSPNYLRLTTRTRGFTPTTQFKNKGIICQRWTIDAQNHLRQPSYPFFRKINMKVDIQPDLFHFIKDSP